MEKVILKEIEEKLHDISVKKNNSSIKNITIYHNKDRQFECLVIHNAKAIDEAMPETYHSIEQLKETALPMLSAALKV
jgi:hypothetical protein